MSSTLVTSVVVTNALEESHEIERLTWSGRRPDEETSASKTFGASVSEASTFRSIG